MAPQNPEFSLHVHKKTAVGRGQDLYTIGIWNGPTLHAICHVQPLDPALSVLRNLLDQAGKPQAPVLPFQQCKAAQSTLRTSLRRLVAAMLASMASFVRLVR